MINLYNSKEQPWKSIHLMICAVLFTLFTSPFVKAQTPCPDPGGGRFDRSLNSTTARSINIYPGLVPSGHTGQEKGTVGYLLHTSDATVAYPANTVTINPLLGGVTGGVTLRFEVLSLVAPDAKIEIFKGSSPSGTPAITLTEANRAAYEATSVAYDGPVTVRFTSPTPAASGSFNVEIRYMTGDQIVTSSFNQKVAVWTQFVQPDSYTFIDDFTLATANTLPISIGYFNASRIFVSAEIGHCLIHDRDQVGVTMNNYPGQMNFQVQTDESDFDRLGSALGVQRLKMARVAWIIANAPKSTRTEMLDIRNAIWSTMGEDYAASYGGLHNQAIAAVPTVPSSSPAAPTLTMSAAAPTAVSGKSLVFTLNVTDGTASSLPLSVKLDVPAGLTINSVTGAAYSGGNLSITSLPATVLITATSTTPQSATLKAIYGSITDFYNPDNFKYYLPCEVEGQDLFQDFVGYSLIEQMFPTAQASATWTAPTALSCDDGYYQILGPNLVRLDKTEIQQTTLLTTLPATDYNAIGYNVNDNFLWGYSPTTNQVFKLGSDGSELFTIPNLPAPTSTASGSVGTIDLNGYLYLYEPDATEYITIDINSSRPTYLQMVDPTNSYIAKTGAPWGTPTIPRNISDWAYNPTTGLIHALINAAGSNPYFVSHLNPVTGISTLSGTAVSGTNFGTGTTEVFPTQFFDTAGNLIVFGRLLFSIDLSNNVATELHDKSLPVSNDGASCPVISAPTAFGCTNLYYQIETDRLYSIDENGTRALIATLSGELDAIGYNTADNFIWGYDNATNQVFKLGENGVIQRFAISNMPETTDPAGYSVGTVSTTGYLYLYEKNASQYITIDINPARTETYLKIVDPAASFAAKTAAPWGTTLSGGAQGLSDWSFNPSDSQIYALMDGSSATPYQILQVDPLTGATTLQEGQVTGGDLQTSAQNFGSSAIGADGTFFVFGNTTGKYYSVNIATKVARQLSIAASPSVSNDGALCPLTTVSPPLPVTLMSFNAYREGNTANLVWVTTSETNTRGFEIERSANATNWTKIGFVEAKSRGANSSSKLEYYFADANPLAGLNYYRLKMVDQDETFAYSQIRAVAQDGAQAMILYPNPSADKLTLKTRGAQKVRSVTIYNMLGAAVLKKSAEGSEDVIDLKLLPAGTYVLSVSYTDGLIMSKMFIKK